jgi:hypothetical protein
MCGNILLKLVPKANTKGNNNISQLANTNICLVIMSNCHFIHQEKRQNLFFFYIDYMFLVKLLL